MPTNEFCEVGCHGSETDQAAEKQNKNSDKCTLKRTYHINPVGYIIYEPGRVQSDCNE